MKNRVIIALTLSLSVGLTLSLHAQRTRAVRKPNEPPQSASQTTPGAPYPGLSVEQLARFSEGLADFEDIETVEDGLGPVFNGRSCAECHSDPATGGDSAELVTRFGARARGTFDPLEKFGGSLIQSQAIGFADGSPHEFRPEQVPPEANVVTSRRTPPLFGLGLVDATPDTVFIALAQQQAVLTPETAGRVHFVWNILRGMRTVGRFGWKSQVPSLEQFAGDAYLNELGITNPLFPDESCPNGDCAELDYNPRPDLNDLGDGVVALKDFMIMLAPLNRGRVTDAEREGERIFERIGCGDCHVATLRTGRSDIPALDDHEYHPYSDFLLHDMGALGDGIEQGDAKGREIRTAPLWGLRALNSYLHDGRAKTIEDAIVAHDGQGRGARRAYERLDQRARDVLVAFLRSL